MKTVVTIVLCKRLLGLILSHLRWSAAKYTITMMSIGHPSGLVTVSEIFSKAGHDDTSTMLTQMYEFM